MLLSPIAVCRYGELDRVESGVQRPVGDSEEPPLLPMVHQEKWDNLMNGVHIRCRVENESVIVHTGYRMIDVAI